MTAGSGAKNLKSLRYGERTISYHLLMCQRKTLEIAVHPDSSVVVKAPAGCDMAQVERVLQKRARWIIRQWRYFEQFKPRTPPRCYVNGETHLYLGRQYRLRAARGDEDAVRLSHGYFYVTVSGAVTPDAVKKLLDEWYLQKARGQFAESLQRCWGKYAEEGRGEMPRLCIKRMRTRWGSYSTRGILTLNLELIRAPRECIDYVVMHELCHLQHHNHSARFYRLLDAVMPEWKKIKHRLETSLA